jgi:hypothetical protein
LEKRFRDIARSEPGPGEWKVKPARLHLVSKEAPGYARPTLVESPPATRGTADEELNPLDGLDWEERFWFAFQAILELERDLEELLGREQFFQCLTCRREQTAR